MRNLRNVTNRTSLTRCSVVKVGVGKLIAGVRRDNAPRCAGTVLTCAQWDAALLTMSVGEKCVITVPPEAAYGPKGTRLWSCAVPLRLRAD